MYNNGYEQWQSSGDDDRSAILQAKTERTSFVLRTLAVLLMMYGLVCLYSASCQYCSNNGLNGFRLCLNQILFGAIGIAVFFFIQHLGDGFFRFTSPFLMLFCLVGWTVYAITGKNFIPQDFVLFILTMISTVLFSSAYMAKRNNGKEKGSQIILPQLFSLCILLMTALCGRVELALVYLVVCCILFRGYGARKGKVIAFFFASAIPVACYILANRQILSGLLNFLIYRGDDDSARAAVMNALASGSLTGTGFGLGAYKFAFAITIFRADILVNIAEELGYVGVASILVSFGLIGICGFSIASRLRKRNLFWSNTCFGMTLVLVAWAFLNIAQSVGLVPRITDGLPFFSYGVQIVFALMLFAFIIRANSSLLEKEEKETPEPARQAEEDAQETTTTD